MPKVIEFEKTFYPHAVVKESDFPKRVMKIGNRNVEGREVYGFFVTEEEFQETVAKKYCFDGYYDVPLERYDRNEPILMSGGNPRHSLSQEHLKKVSCGKFIVTHDTNVKSTLNELGVKVREIKWYHRIGWLLKG
ncbi:MAG: hypothetical protein WA063_02175 [Minisyncoccia bacterium]